MEKYTLYVHLQFRTNKKRKPHGSFPSFFPRNKSNPGMLFVGHRCKQGWGVRGATADCSTASTAASSETGLVISAVAATPPWNFPADTADSSKFTVGIGPVQSETQVSSQWCPVARGGFSKSFCVWQNSARQFLTPGVLTEVDHCLLSCLSCLPVAKDLEALLCHDLTETREYLAWAACLASHSHQTKSVENSLRMVLHALPILSLDLS